MTTTILNFIRLLSILWVLAKHGLIPLLERLPVLRFLLLLRFLDPWRWGRRRRKGSAGHASRIRKVLEELGPTFIKFGQALSTRMDVLPDDIGLEMKKLQDQVAPFEFAKVRKTVEESLGKPLEELYAQFEETPRASASIAQVHHAITRQGREVAVKVIRPNIEKVVEADIRVLYTLADLVNENFPEWRRFHVRRIVDEFAKSLRNEMNFMVEASRAQQFRKNFAGDAMLHVPEVIWTLTGPKVLTMEWVSGLHIGELPSRARELGIDVERVSRNLITTFFKQVFRDGYFHADQHPGNLMIQPDGTVVIVDFGIVAQVSMEVRIQLAEVLQGMLTQDYAKVARVHLRAGWVPPETNEEEFQETVRQIGEPLLGLPLRDISIAQLLGQLFRATEQYQMEVQPHLLLLQKTMLTLEGVGRELNPDLNMWLLAEPLIREWMVDNLGPRGRLKEFGKRSRFLMDSSLEIPFHLQKVLERAAQERLQLRLHDDSLRRLERVIHMGARRTTLAIFGAAFFLGCAVLVAMRASPMAYLPALFLGMVSYMRSMSRWR